MRYQEPNERVSIPYVIALGVGALAILGALGCMIAGFIITTKDPMMWYGSLPFRLLEIAAYLLLAAWVIWTISQAIKGEEP